MTESDLAKTVIKVTNAIDKLVANFKRDAAKLVSAAAELRGVQGKSDEDKEKDGEGKS